MAEELKPVALIGAGGIGKTSIALNVLHHNRIKERFGENRRFIRCNQFPASSVHFLARLSKVIGAGVENPEDLSSLRTFLSSKKILLVLDNAEPLLDPQGENAREIYSVVEGLCLFKNICVLITSRISTVPSPCRRPEIPTLSMEAARDIFYHIYDHHGQSAIIDDLLEQLDFHALSITLLATTASHNAWDYDRLANEWDTRRAQVLQTDHNESLAATIELSLDSPTFLSLDPEARDLLSVIAFFPQGISESNLDWLFPTIPNRKVMFDKFYLLSLTYRNNGFITMLAPIRACFSPKDPQSSPLLCTTRDRYFGRLSVKIDPDMPGFQETEWIVLEDANVEHLLDVSTSLDLVGDDTWEACRHFMDHLYWHKPRETMLGLRIEALPDDHRYKPECLSQLSRLFGQVGNYLEQKRLLTRALGLKRQTGDDSWFAHTLQQLSDANRNLNRYEEGIEQAEEALGIFERIGDMAGQQQCLSRLAWLFLEDWQVDAAEDVATRAVNLATEIGQEHPVCQFHWVLGKICSSKGEKQKAIDHFEAAIGIASPFGWDDVLFWNHFGLASLFRDKNEVDKAHAHIELAKSHAANDTYKLGRAMQMQARVWYRQLRLEEAESEASHAFEVFMKLGAAREAGDCEELLQKIEEAMKEQSTSC